MPSLAVDDLERQFYLQALGVSGVGLTLNDLRSQYYSGVAAGTISLGAKPSVIGVNTIGQTVPLANPGGANGTAAINRATFAPFYLAAPAKISALGCLVKVAAGAGGTVRFGLWKALASGLIDLSVAGELFESGEIASTSTGYKTAAWATTLAAGGPYYFGVVFHVAAAQIANMSSGISIINPGDTTQTFGMMYVDGVTGAFPTSGANVNGDYTPLPYGILA